MIQRDNEGIKLTRVASCIAVVFLHTNGCFWTFSTDGYWFSANIIESVFYFAVPCFFMITGATLMDYRERYSLKIYFDKRIKKTVIPFVAWSAFAIACALFAGTLKFSDITPSYIWNAFINTQTVGIYWFFPVLFGLYMTIPLLSAINQSNRMEVFLFASATLFLFGSVIPFILNVAEASVEWNEAFNIQLGGYVLYLMVGYLIYMCCISPKQRIIIYTLGICGLLMHLCGTYYLSTKAGEIVRLYKGYLNVPCVLYSVAVFTWIKHNYNIILKNRIVKKTVDWISKYTLSIYLLHYFISTLLVRMFDINTVSILYRLGAPFIIVPIVAIITEIVRKIPIVKYILP